MDETDHGLTPRIPDLKVNRKSNEINDLPTPPPRQCWVCEPPVIALKTRGPLKTQSFPQSNKFTFADISYRTSIERRQPFGMAQKPVIAKPLPHQLHPQGHAINANERQAER